MCVNHELRYVHKHDATYLEGNKTRNNSIFFLRLENSVDIRKRTCVSVWG